MISFSKRCPHCFHFLAYKYAHYVDYLVCTECGGKFTESKYRFGTRLFDETELFTLAYYNQPSSISKTVIYFAGANVRGGNQAKKAMNQSRIYKLADEYKFNVICIGVKAPYFEDGKDYTPLIKFLLEQNKLKAQDIILIGFSNGGIPTILTGWQYNFDKVCFVSPVLSIFTDTFCQQIQSEVVLINNLKDSPYFHKTISLLNSMLTNYHKSCLLFNVPVGHTTTKSFERIIEHCF